MGERIVIIVPADAADATSEYFKNFVWHVQQALEKLKVRLVVGTDAADRV